MAGDSCSYAVLFLSPARNHPGRPINVQPATTNMYPSDNVSRLISGRYPEPGTNPIADAIRERRGPTRGLTGLDGNLLHTPRIAQGYNELLGAIRSGGKLPGDVREAMVSPFLIGQMVAP